MITGVINNIIRGPEPSMSLDDNFCNVAAIICLETRTRELIFGGANREIKWCMRQRIHLYDFALSGYLTPHSEDVTAIMVLMDRYRDGGVYVHCRAGHERTGFVCAAFRMQYCGWSFDDAYKEWKEMGCHWLWRLMWSKELRTYEI